MSFVQSQVILVMYTLTCVVWYLFQNDATPLRSSAITLWTTATTTRATPGPTPTIMATSTTTTALSPHSTGTANTSTPMHVMAMDRLEYAFGEKYHFLTSPRWCGCNLQSGIWDSFCRLKSWVPTVKLSSGECKMIQVVLKLGAISQQAITLANVDPVLCRHMASQGGHNG